MNNETTAQAYLRAAHNLLTESLNQLDPEVVRDVSAHIGAGAMLQMQSSWSRAGHVETTITLIYADGERVELAGLELATPRALS